MVFSPFLFTSQGLFEAGYLFIYALLLSEEPNCNLREKKKKSVCEGQWQEGGANKLKSEKGGYIFIKRQHQINFCLVSGTHVKFIGCLLILP